MCTPRGVCKLTWTMTMQSHSVVCSCVPYGTQICSKYEVEFYHCKVEFYHLLKFLSKALQVRPIFFIPNLEAWPK